MARWIPKTFRTKDREQWDRLIDTAPHADVFFCRQYVSLFEKLSGECAHLFFFGDRSNYIVYPFFKRSINRLPLFKASPLTGRSEYFDIVSPYGYSGPLAVISEPSCEQDLWQQFLEAFHQHCLEANIVCEFARLNPFTGNHLPLQEFTDGVEPSNPITYLDLGYSEKELWQGLNRGNRSNINKARRRGVRVDRCSSRAHVDRFHELYTGTMARNDADDWYFLPRDFFHNFFKMLNGKTSLFHADYDGRIIAAASFLHGGKVVHYFLGGSDSQYLSVRPNNILMYEAILWAKSEGYRYFNLGGGHGSEETLARFKTAFSKLTKTFFIYRKVHMARIYELLCHQFVRYREDEGQSIPETDFFPLYRAAN